MELRKLSRFISTLVMLALVITLSPLLFGKNESRASDDNISATPAFPSTTANLPTQTIPLNTETNSVEITPDMVENINKLTIPEDANSLLHMQQAKDAPKKNPNASLNTEFNSNQITPDVAATDTVKNLKAKEEIIHKTQIHPITSAWVVQMGSFKDKNNARRLANRLRAAGYKAFTREVKSQTRVFIGPALTKATAVKLSDQIAQQMHMRSIVINYKPFEL